MHVQAEQRRTYEGQVIALSVTFIQQCLQRLCRRPQPLLHLRIYSMLSPWRYPYAKTFHRELFSDRSQPDHPRGNILHRQVVCVM